MNLMPLKRRLHLYFSVMLCIFLLVACSDGSPSSGSDSNPGTLSFQVVYHRSENGLEEKAASINCDEAGVDKVEAQIFTADDVFLVGSDDWDCNAGQGTVASVPAGSGRTVMVLGKDDDGNFVFCGKKTDIQVDANQNTNVGIINCYSFIPTPMAPENGAEVNADAMGLAWHHVAEAFNYRIIVSEAPDLTDPFIDETITFENFSPMDLVDGHTYYWQAVAIDRHDNLSSGSSIFSFTVSTNHENAPPTVQIVSPADGDIYTTNDSILFGGDSRDSQDGDLHNASLTWRSDIDGWINTGETFSSNTLGAGTHEIILTAIDSDGAIGTANVTIAVNWSPSNTSPIAHIESPAHGTRFAVGDEITFNGSGTDNEDGDLSGASLVWESDLDGHIGSDQVFSLNTLSLGTHRITLTATDSEGAKGKDQSILTVNSMKPIKVLFAIDCSGSMGAAGQGSDPDNKRLAAALAFVQQYNPEPNIFFEIMLWNDSVGETTQVDGNRGFTKDMVEIQRVIDSATNIGTTDYMGTIEGIRTDIRRDILNTEPDIRALTKYIVIFLSDGLDNVAGSSEPRIIEILNAVDDLHEMAMQQHEVGMFSLHTFFLSGIDMTPEDREACIDLLIDMAQYGNGQLLREYDTADEINYINSVDMNW